MANLTKIGQGFAIFFVSIIMTSLMYLMLTSLFDAVNATGDANAVGNTIEGIFWFTTFIIWVLGVIAIPCYLYYQGTTEKDEQPPMIKATIGVLLFIFGILLTIQGYDLITGTITDLMDTAIQRIIFWLGFIINWSALVIIIPYYLVADARSELG